MSHLSDATTQQTPAPTRKPFSPAVTLVDEPIGDPAEKSDVKDVEASEPSSPPKLSNLRKYSLLFVFCVAQFLDVFNISALFSAM
jgi:hypothetical protein